MICNINIFIYFNGIVSIMGFNCTHTALHVPHVSVRWPDDGQERPKHVAITIKKLYRLFLCLTATINNFF
jgi:hypothetical protein